MNPDLTGDVRTLARAVRTDPRNHGGKRTPCPTCGSTRRAVLCADCRAVLHVDPKPVAAPSTQPTGVNGHDADLLAQPNATATPGVDITTRTPNLGTYHNRADRARADLAERPRRVPDYDATGSVVAAAWQRGAALPGFEPPADHRTDVAYGARR